jgi:hypothetical protein
MILVFTGLFGLPGPLFITVFMRVHLIKHTGELAARAMSAAMEPNIGFATG